MAISYKQNDRRIKALVTITAGTPIIPFAGHDAIRADRLIIQAQPGNTGSVKVYNDVPITDETTGAQPLAANIATVCGWPIILAPASSDGLTPGGDYEDSPNGDPYNYVDLRTIAIDGSHSGDTVVVDAHLKI